MAQRTQLDDANNPLHETYACLLANGLEGAGEALRILVNEASRIERAQHLQATPYERSAQRVDYANGYKSKTVLTRLGEVTFEVPQVRSGGFYPSALERNSRSEQAMNLALAEMYVQGRLYPQSDQRIAKAGGTMSMFLVMVSERHENDGPCIDQTLAVRPSRLTFHLKMRG